MAYNKNPDNNNTWSLGNREMSTRGSSTLELEVDPLSTCESSSVVRVTTLPSSAAGTVWGWGHAGKG